MNLMGHSTFLIIMHSVTSLELQIGRNFGDFVYILLVNWCLDPFVVLKIISHLFDFHCKGGNLYFLDFVSPTFSYVLCVNMHALIHFSFYV